jgi:uncharacterized protein YeaO (DUF488 family)
MQIMIKLKRIYEKPAKSDGFRILVDRLWPRGVSKEQARVDLWFKEIAPSDSLRKWFNHDPGKWFEFQEKYKAEITKNIKAWEELKRIVKQKKNVTLLFGARDQEHNNAVVLRDMLKICMKTDFE